MSSRKGMIKRTSIVEEKEKHTFVMPPVFKPTNEILKAEIIQASESKWYFGLVGQKIRVKQIDFDIYLAIDYQKTLWLRLIVLKEDLKLIE